YELSRLANEGNEEAYQELNKWAQQSFAVHCMVWAESYELKGQDLKAFEVVSSYFLSDFATLAEKTRSSIAEYFYAFANPFRSGLLAEFFAGGTTKDILPEVTFKGKIIILDFPVKKYLQLGIYAQAIYKRIWQQAVEVRDVKRNPVPVFMWVDEAQYFLNEEDMMFQTTARSSKACTVMLSQNISNYYATIGGKNPKERVNSLLGNLATKIFHANNDYVTNEWAANTIGKTFQSRTSSSVGKYDSVSVSESLNYQVEPQEFTVLLSGSVINDFDVEGVVTVAGKKWSNGKNFIKVAFNQKAI
ncbi:MAG: TraM recognition domain-containing protein, partial [Bacteroidota bacterium]